VGLPEGARPSNCFASQRRLKQDGLMQVLRSISELSFIRKPLVLAIGVFDGLHRGHQSVLHRAVQEASRVNGVAVPLTFDPHPARVLSPDRAPLLLTAQEHKIHLLAAMGFNHTLVLPFTAEVAATDASDFVTSLATASHSLSAICVGNRWSFGKGRKGNLALLQELGPLHNFEAIGVSELIDVEDPVSSTRVRQAVAAGDLMLARTLLGRPYAVLGTVVEGRRIGRTIGFPTANLNLFNEQLPPLGVYAVKARRISSGAPIDGIANLGFRPTLGEVEATPTLEVHLFHFNEECYGELLEVDFIQFLRTEQKFPDLNQLSHQIKLDKANAIKALFEA
jgi:riboflavin kinase/FMN adenylyltransferase